MLNKRSTPLSPDGPISLLRQGLTNGPGCPGTHSVAQASLALSNPPASTFPSSSYGSSVRPSSEAAPQELLTLQLQLDEVPMGSPQGELSRGQSPLPAPAGNLPLARPGKSKSQT